MRHYRLVHSWPSRLRRICESNLAYITSVFIGYIGTDSIGSLNKRFAASAGVEDEINNQRKAFLDMLAWSEELDNGRQKTRNHGYDVIVGGELFIDYSDHPRKTCHAKPKTQINRRRRHQLLPVADAYRKKLSLRLLSKVSIAVHGRLRSVWRFTYDWSWWYPSGNRPLQQYLASIAALVMVSSSIRLTAWLQNSKKRAERSERLMMSHRDYLRLRPASSFRLSWAVNHYRDNAIGLQSPARQKCQRTEAGERGNYWHADASAWCWCARCKIQSKELAMLKLKWCSAWWCCCWSSPVVHQQSGRAAWSHHRLRRG